MTNNPSADSLTWPPPVQASIGSGSPPVGLPNISTPAARVYRTTNFNVLNNTYTPIVFTAKRFDTDNIFGSGSRLTCRTSGLYLITGGMEWVANVAGNRYIRITLNGGTVISYGVMVTPFAGATFPLNITTIYQLNVDDYVELSVQQSTGSPLDVVATANYSPEFGMGYVGAV